MSNPSNSDQTCNRISHEIRLAEPELRELGDRVSSDLDEFLLVQERFTAKAAAYEAQVQLVLQLALTRKPLRLALVEAEQAAWTQVSSAGAVAAPKPRQQVEQERKLLFPHGRPGAASPGDHVLVQDTDALVSVLTGDSALARAWPAENLASILAARDAFVPAWEEWKQATYRRSVLLTELETLRQEWYDKLGLLRDEVKSAHRRLKLPNRFASLFRYRKPSAAAQAPPRTE